MSTLPVLYSFRRCPYAIRARLAIAASGVAVELREIVLRDKAPDFLETSPSATVPCLKLEEGVLDESLDIMVWALEQRDPEGWLSPGDGSRADMHDLIAFCDGPFKRHLDRYKYDDRYRDVQRMQERELASQFLWQLNRKLEERSWLFGAHGSLADYAVLPFVRQFANTDRDWFDRRDWQPLKTWLGSFETSDRFLSVMPKWARWQAGDPPVRFPG